MTEYPKLNDCTVLITRPRQQAEGFRHMLEQHGANTILLPAIEIAPRSGEPLPDTLQSRGPFDIAIFTSANAVEHFLPLLNQNPSCLATSRIAGIGIKTAMALESCNLRPGIVPTRGFNSEALLDSKPMQEIAGKNILLVKGAGGRGLIQNALQQRGACVITLDVYERKCPRIDIKRFNELAASKIDIITLTSMESVVNLFTLLHGIQWLESAPLLVGSQRILHQLRDLPEHNNPLHAAGDPTDESMLKSLLEWKDLRFE